jgi:hypothetical protein
MSKCLILPVAKAIQWFDKRSLFLFEPNVWLLIECTKYVETVKMAYMQNIWQFDFTVDNSWNNLEILTLKITVIKPHLKYKFLSRRFRLTSAHFFLQQILGYNGPMAAAF